MSMLGIKVSDQFLKLYPKQRVPMRLKSPLFVYGATAQSRSLPFNIPIEGNAWILKFFNEPDTRNKVVTFDAELWLLDNFWCTAKLDIVNSNKNDFKIQLRLGKGILGDYSERSLRSFEYNNPLPYRTAFEAYRKFKFEFVFEVPAPEDFAFTLQLQATKANLEIRITYQVGWSLDSFLNYVRDTINAQFTITFVMAEVRAGFLYIYDMLEWGNVLQVFEADITSLDDISFVKSVENPFPFSGFGNTAAHAKEVNEATIGEYDYAYVPVKNPNYFGEDNPSKPVSLSSYINRYSPGPLVNVTTTLDKSQPTTPFPYLFNTLRLLYAEMGVAIDDRFFDEELKSLLIFSNFEGNHVSVTSDSGGNFVYNMKTFFKFADLLPDIQVKEFLYKWANNFCVVQDLDASGRKVMIVSRKSILQSAEYEDWTDILDKHFEHNVDEQFFNLAFDQDDTDDVISELLKEIDNSFVKAEVSKSTDLPVGSNAEGDLRKVKSENTFYQVQRHISAINSDTWTPVAQDYFNKENNNARETIYCAAPVLTLLENCPTVDVTHKWLIPQVKQNGRSGFYKSPTSEVKLRLMFYRGMRRTVNSSNAYTSNYYPLANSHQYDVAGTQIGDRSLSFDGEGGTYETCWKDWMEYMAAAEKGKTKGLISAERLINMKFLVPKKVGNQHYFIDEIALSIGEEIDEADVTIYRR